MLVLGPFALGKRQVKSKPSRVAGAIWVSYLPLVFAFRFLLKQLDPEETINPDILFGILLGLCLPAGAIVILRSVYAGSGQRRRGVAAAATRNPFVELPSPASPPGRLDVSTGPDDFFTPPPPAPSPKKPGRRPPEKNPFDFS
jgi:hypothetical protein